MTETISHIALKQLNTASKQSYFTVLEGVSISTDSRDCLVIHTPALRQQTVFTNDVVHMLSPSTFEWIGRIDNVINTGGVKVQAEKVEKAVEGALAKLQLHRRFFVAPLPDSLLGEAVTVFMEGRPLPAVAEKSIIHYLTAY
jgi:O-succinylbenzoic acid--CoA ligase